MWLTPVHFLAPGLILRAQTGFYLQYLDIRAIASTSVAAAAAVAAAAVASVATAASAAVRVMRKNIIEKN